mmetsp:Transcript_9333/g.14004  ORF Transcript_9333/g.14004 Transcript_9333/m.14004 type:complete len:126 (-) Transcript_9333:2096-2473(-)
MYFVKGILDSGLEIPVSFKIDYDSSRHNIFTHAHLSRSLKKYFNNLFIQKRSDKYSSDIEAYLNYLTQVTVKHIDLPEYFTIFQYNHETRKYERKYFRVLESNKIPKYREENMPDKKVNNTYFII